MEICPCTWRDLIPLPSWNIQWTGWDKRKNPWTSQLWILGRGKLIEFLVLSCLIEIKATKLVHNITNFYEFLNLQASLTGSILFIQLFPWNIRYQSILLATCCHLHGISQSLCYESYHIFWILIMTMTVNWHLASQTWLV